MMVENQLYSCFATYNMADGNMSLKRGDVETPSNRGSESQSTIMGEEDRDHDEKLAPPQGYGNGNNGRRSGEPISQENDEQSHHGSVIQPPEQSTQAFEVTFNKGDQDPDCPRSMGVLRKWMIVCIVAGGSFCVYVFLGVLNLWKLCY